MRLGYELPTVPLCLPQSVPHGICATTPVRFIATMVIPLHCKGNSTAEQPASNYCVNKQPSHGDYFTQKPSSDTSTSTHPLILKQLH